MTKQAKEAEKVFAKQLRTLCLKIARELEENNEHESAEAFRSGKYNRAILRLFRKSLETA